MDEIERPDGISRRRMLKRIGAGAAIAWSAPVLTSLRIPAFAQSTSALSCQPSTNPDGCTCNFFANFARCPGNTNCFCDRTIEGTCFCDTAIFEPGGADCTSSGDCDPGNACLQIDCDPPTYACVTGCANGTASGTPAK